MAPAPAAAAVRKNLARVSRNFIATSFFRHVDDCASVENSERHIDAARTLFARRTERFGSLRHCLIVGS